MAMVGGGDSVEITASNPILGTVFFFPVSGSDLNIDLGGYRPDDDGVVDGAGRLINSYKNKPWMVEAEVTNDMVNTNELEAAKAIAASLSETSWTFTHYNGTTYSGPGTIQGDLKLNTQKSTFTLKFTGSPSQLVKQ